MIINKIKLENIRSYIDQTITFPEGSILLSGDVGAGKSTVLLSIEFALFGISKGYLSGQSLLRNGKNKGSVTLEFFVNNKKVIIKRTLKKTGTSVAQDVGYIEINDVREELSAIELKQSILDLLNYPQDSLTKSKSLIYRYTVYTPQEEMKTILFSDKDTRLDLLRRVFGIDRYKIIKDNTKILTTNLREKKKEIEALISNSVEIESQKNNLEASIISLNEELLKTLPTLEESKLTLSKKLESIGSIESDIKLMNEIKREISLIDAHLSNKNYDIRKTMIELEDLKKSIHKLEEIEPIDILEVSKLISSKEIEIKDLENGQRKLSYEISSSDVQIRNSSTLKLEILSLQKCPVCHQEVNENHKHNIESTENKKIDSAQELKKSLTLRETELKSKIELIKNEISSLQKTKYGYELHQLKIKNNKEKQDRISNLESYQYKINLELKDLESKKIETNKKLELFLDIESKYVGAKKEIDILRGSHTNLEIQKSRTETKINEYSKQVSQLSKELEKKYELRVQLNKISILYQWIDSFFIPMIDNIERSTMSKINIEFNEIFQRWFKMIMDIEGLNIRLDDNFSPIIDQNGYEVEFDNLSGGEKTAASLSYRLALNQVINGLVSTINTKDLIILDEPTDGFSEDQLDKIRIVLNELNTKQTILVSHESKIESFVENIIRFNKDNHITSIHF